VFARVQDLAEAIRQAVEAHTFPQAGQATVTLGVTAYRAGDSAAAMVERANQAIHQAKGQGGNRVQAVG
jgi:GGDEF domain-containing protein